MTGPHQARDRIGRPAPRNPFTDAVSIGRAIPGLLEQFSKVVPAGYVDGDTIACVCGSSTLLPVARVVECSGGCGRFFLRGSEVRCASYPKEAVA